MGGTAPPFANSWIRPWTGPPKFLMARHVKSRHNTFDVSSACIIAVSSLSNSTARHARQYWSVTTSSIGSTRRTCRVLSRRDVTSQVEFGLYNLKSYSRCNNIVSYEFIWNVGHVTMFS